jgi:FkbM family methyltransferase
MTKLRSLIPSSATPSPGLSELIARAYVRRWLPARLARGLFWRLATRSERIKSVVITAPVQFPDSRLTLRLPLSNRLNWLMLFQGIARSEDAAMLEVFCDRARNAALVLDIGVNAGLYTYHAASVCSTDTMIIGLEANAALVATVNANLRANGRHNAAVRHAAATDRAGTIAFYFGSEDQIASVERTHVAEFGDVLDTVTVPALTVDVLVDECGKCPDLVKIDVEGHELAVLRGMVRTLTRCQPTLMIELKADNVADADALLRAHGYGGRRWQHDRVLVSDLDPGVATHANYLYESVD